MFMSDAPETDEILNIFLALWALVNLLFCNNQIEKRRLNLLDNYMKKFRSVVGGAVVIGAFGAFGAEGRWFDSTSSRHVGALGKSFTRNCLYDVMRRL